MTYYTDKSQGFLGFGGSSVAVFFVLVIGVAVGSERRRGSTR